MARIGVVDIPYTPRYRDVHKTLEEHRFSVLVAHRRFGKTVLVINHLIKSAILCRKRDGNLAYIAPFRNQAKDVAWVYLKRYTAAIPGRMVNESELSIRVPSIGGGARIRLFGADNPDALRGLYFDGVVLDEVAQMKPDVWEEVLRPALSDRRGWAVFIGTPKGVNLFKDLYDKALRLQEAGDKEWCAMLYTVEQTSALPREEVENVRNEMSEASFAQEYLCDFNATADDVLIPTALVLAARQRHLDPGSYEHAPLVMGVDVARKGDDSTVITLRRGHYCEEQKSFHGLDVMEVVGQVARIYRDRHPDAVFVDGVGVGAGAVDRLKELGIPAVDAQAGARALNPAKFANRRAEMWTEMRDWLRNAVLPPDDVLLADLTSVGFSYQSSGALLLEKKEDVKERLRRSPDRADALALTFYAPVFSAGLTAVDGARWADTADMSYDPLGGW